MHTPVERRQAPCRADKRTVILRIAHRISAGGRLPPHTRGYTLQGRSVPVLLDMSAPRLRGYTPETVVAEKFQAIVASDCVNSHMERLLQSVDAQSVFRFREVLACKGDLGDLRTTRNGPTRTERVVRMEDHDRTYIKSRLLPPVARVHGSGFTRGGTRGCRDRNSRCRSASTFMPALPVRCVR